MEEELNKLNEERENIRKQMKELNRYYEGNASTSEYGVLKKRLYDLDLRVIKLKEQLEEGDK